MKIKYYPSPYFYHSICIEKEEKNEKWVVPYSKCPDKYTKLIESCTTNEIIIDNDLNMKNNIIFDENILGYKLGGNATIYYWTPPNTYTPYVYGTNVIVSSPLYYKLDSYTSYGGLVPEYTTDVSNSTRLRIPYDGLYALTLNLILREGTTSGTGFFSVQFFLSKNSGVPNLDISTQGNIALSFTQVFAGNTANTGSCNFSNVLKLQAGDYINFGIIVTSDAGGATPQILEPSGVIEKTDFTLLLLEKSIY
jgi:hypothetical protein